MFDCGKERVYNFCNPTQPDLSPLPALLPEQEFLSGYVSTVLGPIEYREWESQLERIHELLGLSRVEQASCQRLCSQVLRCNVARTPMGASLRDFGCRLVESPLLQWFCKVEWVGGPARIPGKSALQRYSQ